MSQSCIPKDLLKSAGCFACLTPRLRESVKTSLLCRIASSSGGAPTTPTNPNIDTTSTDGNLIITWNLPTIPDSTEVWVNRNGGGYVLFANVPGPATSTVDNTAMFDGDQWYYKMRAVKGGVFTAFTAQVGAFKEFHLNATADAAISFPDLVFACGPNSFFVEHMANLVSISVPKLHTSLGVTGANFCDILTSVNFNSLVRTEAIFSLYTNVLLPSLSLPAAVTLDSFSVQNNGSITSISLPSLTTIFNGGFAVAANPNMSVCSAPLLASIAAELNMNGANSMVSISFPSLTTIGGYFDCANAGSLTNINFTPLILIGSSWASDFCTLLTSVLFPNLIWVNTGQSVTSTACALNLASVDLFLRRAVVSGFGPSGEFIDLSGGTNAIPDAAGQADKAFLIGQGCIVNTN